VLHWSQEGIASWDAIIQSLQAFTMPEGTRLVVAVSASDPGDLRVVAYGHSAHAGVNLEGGRNALVALARALEGKLPRGGGDDLLTFARLAGSDIHGSGLGFTETDPLWGSYGVNVATIKLTESGMHELTINIRSIPPLKGAERKSRMQQFVADFNVRSGASLQMTANSFWDDEPLAFDPNGKLVRRLLAAYGAATGEAHPKPAISGGGTYAKRLPNAIAFGMWFPDKPYPGHDVNERNPIDDLMKGTRVLIRAIADIGGGKRIEEPFKP